MKLSHTSNELHASLMPLIPHDEQEKQTGWFSKVIKHKDDFIEDVNAWFSVTRLRGSPRRPLLVANRSNESPLLHEAAEEENGGVENVEVTGPQSHNVQDDIQPDDSISNYSSQNHGSKSIRSKVSSTASARVRAEAEMAALMARKRLLEQKHALEEEEAKIRHALQEQEARVRKQKEQLQLETDMAASAAKLNVLRTSGSGVRSVASQKLDGMEVYFESGLNFNAETFVRQNVGDVGRGQPAEFGGTRPKQRQCDGNKHLQRTSAPTQAQSTVPKAVDAVDLLHYLEQYTRGQPKQLVRSCQHMTDGIGYATAKALLQEHFGNEHVIASAYMDKSFAWPAIKSEDGKALQAYSLFLRGCHNAMKDVYNLSDLNTSANMVSVIKKLPYKLRDKWRAKACDIQEKHRKRTMFADIVTFIEREVRITTDPVFGDIQDAPVIGAFKESGRAKPVPRPKARGSSFATTFTTVERDAHWENRVKDGPEKTCLFCKKGRHTHTGVVFSTGEESSQ